jgi:hypothetical protein
MQAPVVEAESRQFQFSGKHKRQRMLCLAFALTALIIIVEVRKRPGEHEFHQSGAVLILCHSPDGPRCLPDRTGRYTEIEVPAQASSGPWIQDQAYLHVRPNKGRASTFLP